MTMAFMMSFGFGVLLVLVLDRMDNAVRSADEAEELSGLPMLAVIPVHRGDTANTPKELADNPRSPLADAIRSLRVTLDLGEGEGKARVIMVTSSMPKEGKTFASLCLATMLSRVEARVLLIDGDLHRPKLHAAFGVTGETGLAQVLAGQASIEDVLIRNAADGLDFMPAGLLSKVADLVNEPQVEALLHSLAQYYDRIVVDLPPVLAVADPRIFSRFADRVLYLIKWNSTPRDAVRNGLKLLGDANVTVHGVVLSQVDQKKYSRYAYGDYGNYYGRYKEYYQS
ncbi:MAG TPA: polysaccharide biosynthesis tyrosine autokinase [Patescibacteria group bacterium]|nr:polysaccharide biosynthesis tyrosine autokinase [Patescibacteria group bacterium]